MAVSAGNRLGELVALRDLYDRRLLLLGASVLIAQGIMAHMEAAAAHA